MKSCRAAARRPPTGLHGECAQQTSLSSKRVAIDKTPLAERQRHPRPCQHPAQCERSRRRTCVFHQTTCYMTATLTPCRRSAVAVRGVGWPCVFVCGRQIAVSTESSQSALRQVTTSLLQLLERTRNGTMSTRGWFPKPFRFDPTAFPSRSVCRFVETHVSFLTRNMGSSRSEIWTKVRIFIVL